MSAEVTVGDNEGCLSLGVIFSGRAILSTLGPFLNFCFFVFPFGTSPFDFPFSSARSPSPLALFLTIGKLLEYGPA